MRKPKQVRVSDVRGEFSVVESRVAFYEKNGCKVLRDKPAADANGEPLPFKPRKNPASAQTENKASSSESAPQDGQKANR